MVLLLFWNDNFTCSSQCNHKQQNCASPALWFPGVFCSWMETLTFTGLSYSMISLPACTILNGGTSWWRSVILIGTWDASADSTWWTFRLVCSWWTGCSANENITERSSGHPPFTASILFQVCCFTCLHHFSSTSCIQCHLGQEHSLLKVLYSSYRGEVKPVKLGGRLSSDCLGTDIRSMINLLQKKPSPRRNTRFSLIKPVLTS